MLFGNMKMVIGVLYVTIIVVRLVSLSVQDKEGS
jgi:hypothetical protein